MKRPKDSAEHIIIGNSAAAIGAVEAIRQSGDTRPILLISDEVFPAYSRPLISELLGGQIGPERMPYRPAEFYKSHGVEALLGVRVERVDPETSSIILQDGRRFGYKNLLIATGSSPAVPPIEGREAKGVFTFMRWEEAVALQEAAPQAKQAVVIGAGLIGLKAAEALRHQGLEVTVVELAPRILPAAADEKAALMIENHLLEHSVRVLTSQTAQKIESKDGQVKAVLLKSKERLPAEIVVIAVGVKPNTQIIENTKVTVRRGIPVNSKMRTNIKNIYAAGDVAEGYDLIMEDNRLLPLWPVAYKQGTIAGANMAGIQVDYDGYFAMNSIELFGLPLISMGLLEKPEDTGYEVISSNEGINYKKFILKDNVIVGAVFLNAIDRAGIVTGLIREKISVSEFKQELLKEDFGLLSLPREWRKEKIGLKDLNRIDSKASQPTGPIATTVGLTEK